MFGLMYWGTILTVFGIITIFIVPQYSLNRVVARSVVQPALPATNPPPPAVISNPPPILTNTVAKTPEFPNVTIQGVIYRPPNTCVIIRGKPFFVGDFIEEAKIVEIERDSVTLQLNAQRKVLDILQ
jgi:hypothetical protein